MALTSFGIREKWLRMLIKVIPNYPDIFTGLSNTERMEEAQYQLGGLGNKQVPAVKDWGVGIGLIEKDAESNYQLTPFGKIIAKYDPQFEEQGTFWAIHYNLSVNSFKPQYTDKSDDMWFYSMYANKFPAGTVLRNEIKACFKGYKKKDGSDYSDNVIDSCLSHLLDTMTNTKIGEELGVFSITDEAKNLYERRHPTESTLHPAILAYMLCDWANFNSRLTMNTAEFFRYGSVACLMAMDEQQFNAYLNKIQDRYSRKVLWVSWTAGLNSVGFEKTISPLSMLQAYYIEQQSGEAPLEALNHSLEL